MTADLASLTEVRDLARRLRGDLQRLDDLINNAGVISRTRRALVAMLQETGTVTRAFTPWFLAGC